MNPNAKNAYKVALARIDHLINIYGTWIYDKDHCCHTEIHFAEQIWRRKNIASTKNTTSTFSATLQPILGGASKWMTERNSNRGRTY